MRVQVIGTPDSDLYDALAEQLNGGDTFVQTGTVRKHSATFGHVKYDSVLNILRGESDVVLASIAAGTKDKVGSEMLKAFVGFLCRNLADSIYTVSIQFD